MYRIAFMTRDGEHLFLKFTSKGVELHRSSATLFYDPYTPEFVSDSFWERHWKEFEARYNLDYRLIQYRKAVGERWQKF